MEMEGTEWWVRAKKKPEDISGEKNESYNSLTKTYTLNHFAISVPKDYDFLFAAGVVGVFGPGTVISKAAGQILGVMIEGLEETTHK